jgi:hypothetical protein
MTAYTLPTATTRFVSSATRQPTTPPALPASKGTTFPVLPVTPANQAAKHAAATTSALPVSTPTTSQVATAYPAWSTAPTAQTDLPATPVQTVSSILMDLVSRRTVPLPAVRAVPARCWCVCHVIMDINCNQAGALLLLRAAALKLSYQL